MLRILSGCKQEGNERLLLSQTFGKIVRASVPGLGADMTESGGALAPIIDTARFSGKPQLCF
jgi:hypothetical protein